MANCLGGFMIEFLLNPIATWFGVSIVQLILIAIFILLLVKD